MSDNVNTKKPERQPTERARETAKARLLALEEFLQTTQQKMLSSGERTRLANQKAREIKVSIATFYRLLNRHNEGNGTTDALLPNSPGLKPGWQLLPLKTETIIGEEIDGFYLSPQRPRFSDLVHRIHSRCHIEGLKLPHLRTIKSRIATRRPDHIHRKRYGARAAKEKFSPIMGKLEAEHPLQIIQIDHTKVDLIVVDEHSGQPIGRPWLTLAIDIYTRMVVGFYLSFDPPSTTSLAICLAASVLDKTPWLASLGIKGEWPVQGIPEIIHVDNGKEFHSRPFETACERYAISIQHRPPRTPHYGGHIERLIGTLMGGVHALPGTTFSSVAEKNDYDSEQHATLTLTQLERWLMLEIVGKYHQKIHRSLDMPPIEKWRQSSRNWQPRSPKKPREFWIDFLPYEERQVRRDGIHLFNISYWSDALTSFLVNGEKVKVHYDPRNLAKVFVRGRAGDFLDIPYRNNLGRPAITLWEHRLARSQLQKAGRAAVDEALIFETIKEQRSCLETGSVTSSHARRKLALLQPTLTEQTDISKPSESEENPDFDPPVVTPIYDVRYFDD